MKSWADELILQYEKGRKGLGKMKQELNDDSLRSKMDKSQINSMISTMTESIDWMTTGREPGRMRGADKHSAYQRKSLTDMDLFPSLDIKPDKKQLSNEEKEAIHKILSELSPRERQCFLLHKAYLMSFGEISKELGIGRSTVQKYIERAKEKIISCRAVVVQKNLY